MRQRQPPERRGEGREERLPGGAVAVAQLGREAVPGAVPELGAVPRAEWNDGRASAECLETVKKGSGRELLLKRLS